MNRHLRNLAYFAIGVILSMVFFLPSAYAAEPVPIAWTIGYSPPSYCAAVGTGTTPVEYGYPSTFRCLSAEGGVTSWVHAHPSCPTGYVVDFEKLFCMPTATAGDQILAMPMEDAKSLAWHIVTLWVAALCCRMLIRSLNSTTEGDSNA
jgi:hypothetical protein